MLRDASKLTLSIQTLDMSQSGIQEIVETQNSFVSLLSSPATTNQIMLKITEISSTGITESTITIEAKVEPGKLLVVISKANLTKLVRGSNYSITVRRGLNENTLIM